MCVSYVLYAEISVLFITKLKAKLQQQLKKHYFFPISYKYICICIGSWLVLFHYLVFFYLLFRYQGADNENFVLVNISYQTPDPVMPNVIQ